MKNFFVNFFLAILFLHALTAKTLKTKNSSNEIFLGENFLSEKTFEKKIATKIILAKANLKDADLIKADFAKSDPKKNAPKENASKKSALAENASSAVDATEKNFSIDFSLDSMDLADLSNSTADLAADLSNNFDASNLNSSSNKKPKTLPPLELLKILSPEKISSLLENGHERIEYKKNTTCNFELLPKTPLCEKIKNSWSSENAPNFSLEDLYLVKKSDLLKDDSEKDVSLSKTRKIMQSLSKMEGIQYYSNGDKKWETLFHKCYFIDDPKTKNKIPDQNFENVNEIKCAILQDDNSFGLCVYDLVFFENDFEISVLFDLADWITFGPFKAIKPGELKINFAVIDCGENYVVYILSQAKFASLGIIEKRVSRSIGARIDAIANWFLGEF